MNPEFVDPTRVEYGSCPLCQSRDVAFLRDQDWSWRDDYDQRLFPVIRWVTCGACRHQFTWGYFKDEMLEVVFRRAQPGQTAAGMRGTDIEAARFTWAKVVDAVSLHRGTGTWLDVGAGSGMLAAVAYECGFDVVTIESRPDAAEALRERGIPVMSQGVLDLPAVAPDQFDVISLCDVLEHMPFPSRTLEAVWPALRGGGILFVSCPNTDSLAWRALDQEDVNPYWAEVEHYHNFSFRRLQSLLAQYGFQTVTCSVSNRYRVCMDVIARKVGGDDA